MLALAAPRPNHAERAERYKGGHGFAAPSAYSERWLQLIDATIESEKVRDDAAAGGEDRGPETRGAAFAFLSRSSASHFPVCVSVCVPHRPFYEVPHTSFVFAQHSFPGKICQYQYR